MVVSFSLNHRAVLKTPSPPPPPPDMKVSSYMCNIILISCYFKVKKLHNVALRIKIFKKKSIILLDF